MENLSISYAVICLNEERTILRCLKAISSNCNKNDEIIVVDTGSKDKTKELVEEKFPNVKLYDFKWNGSFSSARNYCIKLAKKDWIFFIDADETLSPNSGYNLKRHIFEVNKIAPRPFVMVPKIINTNGNILYNAGRIMPNNSQFNFYGLIHEYPVINNRKDEKGYDTIKLDDVAVYHDGYEPEIMKSKSKPCRNSKLDKIMLKKLPNSIRYNYLYYRDSESIISEDEYVKGMTKTFLMDKNNKFSQQAGISLLIYYVNKKKFDLADKYVEKLAELVEKPNSAVSKWELVYLSSINDLNRLKSKEAYLLKTLIAVKNNHENEINEIFKDGMNYDELIGLIFLSLGRFKEALDICKSLNKKNFTNQLSNKICEFEKILESNHVNK